MPCNANYMNPSQYELELSRVASFIDEINSGEPLNKTHYNGYHPDVYCKNPDRTVADTLVRTLCNKLKQDDVSKYSLEMQIWWRDHQIADQERAQKENQV